MSIRYPDEYVPAGSLYDTSYLDEYEYTDEDIYEDTNEDDIIDDPIFDDDWDIEKCIVICSNCHRRYHGNRFCLLSDKPKEEHNNAC